jgi:hypothetical protein
MSGNDITKIQTDTVYFIGKTGNILVCIEAFAYFDMVIIQVPVTFTPSRKGMGERSTDIW